METLTQLSTRDVTFMHGISRPQCRLGVHLICEVLHRAIPPVMVGMPILLILILTADPRSALPDEMFTLLLMITSPVWESYGLYFPQIIHREQVALFMISMQMDFTK